MVPSVRLMSCPLTMPKEMSLPSAFIDKAIFLSGLLQTYKVLRRGIATLHDRFELGAVLAHRKPTMPLLSAPEVTSPPIFAFARRRMSVTQYATSWTRPLGTSSP